ncbi:MAG: hypothetical protein RIG61_00225 [Deltaproteobacteria bacterium]
MIDETSVPLERAARMLNIGIEGLLERVIELGIEVKHDEDTGIEYITEEAFNDLKETKSIID